MCSSQQLYRSKCSPVVLFFSNGTAGLQERLPLHVFLLCTVPLCQHFKDEAKGRRVSASSSEAGFLKQERMQQTAACVVLAQPVNKCRRAIERDDGLKGNPAYSVPHDCGEHIKGIKSPDVLWQWDSVWMRKFLLFIKHRGCDCLDLNNASVNTPFTCIFFP